LCNLFKKPTARGRRRLLITLWLGFALWVIQEVYRFVNSRPPRSEVWFSIIFGALLLGLLYFTLRRYD
jgi:hypothetical protein